MVRSGLRGRQRMEKTYVPDQRKCFDVGDYKCYDGELPRKCQVEER